MENLSICYHIRKEAIDFMKVYVYYLIDKDLIKMLKNRCLMDWIGISNDDVTDNCLYAYTKKKKIAEAFEKTRNMNIFLKKVVDMDDYEFDHLRDVCSSYAELHIHEFLYPFGEEVLMFKDPIRCNIAITSSESWFAEENYKESIMDYLYGLPKIENIKIFRDDIYHILKDMDYNDSVVRNKDYIRTDEDLSPVASYSCNFAWENKIGILIFLYKGFFNEEAIVEVIKDAGSK